jgi:hypothetical protein
MHFHLLRVPQRQVVLVMEAGGGRIGIDPTKLGSFARMDDPGARPHVVRDIMDIAPEPWTYERPMLLFRVDKREDVKFVMHYLIPGVVLSQTGLSP